jgi:hypothetical protein
MTRTIALIIAAVAAISVGSAFSASAMARGFAKPALEKPASVMRRSVTPWVRNISAALGRSAASDLHSGTGSSEIGLLLARHSRTSTIVTLASGRAGAGA